MIQIKTHKINNSPIAEIISDGILIKNEQDGLDLMGNVYYQGFDKIIIHKHNLTDDFFELKNKLAGEILQKFSNYRIRLVIVGDFSEFNSKSLNDFIFESNQGKQINFLNSVSEALEKLS
ncbi:DUF4180 domain-containing protein [Moheibacter sediminis]|uniref:DUF4180 domain-containing protein n=1 Tax=Moheibacter sediminis TaxID=1434700 RepID=A0A1W1ZA95_9FLAO|nr:DUF4180 domain-containing protein [Moheibacter sediminis]SMC45141.1 protein of unknown function [Moheibacter sediminis]